MTKATTYHNTFIGLLEWNGTRSFHSWFLPAAQYTEMPKAPVVVYGATLTLSHWQRREITWAALVPALHRKRLKLVCSECEMWLSVTHTTRNNAVSEANGRAVVCIHMKAVAVHDFVYREPDDSQPMWVSLTCSCELSELSTSTWISHCSLSLEKHHWNHFLTQAL